MTHDEGIRRILPMGKSSRANGKGFSAHLTFYEVCAGNGRNRESPDVIFFRNDGVTDLIEVKVDRTDFLRDKKKLFRQQPELGMGMYRYMACPEHLINSGDLPPKWGLIWIPEKGKPYIKIKSKEFEPNYRAERDLLFSLMRRTNDFLPIERCVEYDKIVKRYTNAQMKAYSIRPDEKAREQLPLLEKTRKAFWDKMQGLIRYHRR